MNEIDIKNVKIVNDLNGFKNRSELIVCNRVSKDLSEVTYKIYTRDLFNKD